MQVETEFVYVLKLNQEEYNLLFEGIGNTSHIQMVESGMTDEQASFFCELYRSLAIEKD